jgi:hypothetical protein
MKKISLCHALALVSCFFVASADANGINPPRTVGSETVIARCIDRATGGITTLQRARITEGDSGRPLEVQVGKEAPRMIQLSQLLRLQFDGGKPRPDGFARATLELAEPAFVGEAVVKVRSGKKRVLISGFNAASERVQIPLERCKELEFKQAPSSESEFRDVMKKSGALRD